MAFQQVQSNSRSLLASPGWGIVVWVAVSLGVTSLSASRLNAQFTHLIDQEVQRQHVSSDGVLFPACSDAVFLRRVYLDLTGGLPSVDEARTFLENRDADKRSQLIDELINRPSFGRHLADRWDTRLTYADLKWPLIPFTNWLQMQFNNNRPWNLVVEELLTASGPQYRNPAVTMFLGSGKNSTLTPEEATDLVGECFMGVKLECAQCHDHPDASWTHRQYWGIAGFLGNTQLSSQWPGLDDAPSRTDWEWKGATYGVAESNAPDWRYQPPERSLNIPASFPTDGGELERWRVSPSASSPRAAFANWLMASETPFVARAMVNSTWHHLFGCGLVTPVGDHRSNNPALYADLHRELVDAFRASGYDVKALFAGICRSSTYQQASTTHQDPRDLAGVNVRTLTPNQTFDVLLSILGEEAMTYRRGIYGARGARRGFLSRFGDDAVRDEPTQFAKSLQDTLQFLNSERFESGMRWRISQYRELWDDPEEMIETLFLLTVSRPPNDKEMSESKLFVDSSESLEAGYQGVLWALLNSAEFYLVR